MNQAFNRLLALAPFGFAAGVIILLICLFVAPPRQPAADGRRHPFAVWFTIFTATGIHQGQCTAEFYYFPKDDAEFQMIRAQVQAQVLGTNNGYVALDRIERED